MSDWIAGSLNVVLVLLLAPLFQGIQRKLTARIQARQGPPLWQPYYDLLKLLGKEDLEVGESPLMQRFAALLSLAIVFTIALLVPMGWSAAGARVGDSILLIYLLTLMGICTLLAGLAAGSTYSLLGTSREMMAMVTLEPLLAFAVLVSALHGHSLQLGVVLNGAAYAGGGVPWSGLAMAALIVVGFQAFLQRIPFDIAEAETELMDGPLMEYSGPKLALFKYAQMAKLVVYGAIFIGLFAPWGASLHPVLSWLLFWMKTLVLVVGVTLIAALHARYRIDQALRYFVGMLAAAMVAVALAAYGY